MIHGSRGGPARPLRAAVLAFAAAACVLLPALPAAAGVAPQGPPWAPAWSWRAGSAGPPPACSPAAGTTGGIRLSPSGPGFADGASRIDPAGTRDGGTGIACRMRLPDSARVVLRARLPETPGVLTRIGLSVAPAGTGPGWCGLALSGRGAAYVWTGSGEGADVVRLPGALAGSTHVLTLTWAPTTFTVAVDGREVRRERHPEAGDGVAARWLTIGATTTGRGPRAEPLVVTALAVETPRSPSRAGTVAALPAVAGAVSAVAGAVSAVAGAVPAAPAPAAPAPAAPAPVPAAPLPLVAVPAAAAGPLFGQVGSEVDGRLPDAVAALQTTTLAGPWLLAGTCAGVGVLLGVLRAAIAARRRPVAGA